MWARHVSLFRFLFATRVTNLPQRGAGLKRFVECSGSVPLLISRVVVVASRTSATEQDGLYEGQAQEFHEWTDVRIVSRKWFPQRSPREHPAAPKDSRKCYPHPLLLFPSTTSLSPADTTHRFDYPGNCPRDFRRLCPSRRGWLFRLLRASDRPLRRSVWSITPDVLAFLVYEQAHRRAAKRPRLEL